MIRAEPSSAPRETERLIAAERAVEIAFQNHHRAAVILREAERERDLALSEAGYAA